MTRTQQLEYLIHYLAPDLKLPANDEEQWRLFRALVNIREPGEVSKEFLEVQNDLLKNEIAVKGITDIDDLKPIRKNLYLWQGDITPLRVDAIVNAANSSMTGCYCPNHGCIDNAIHTFAGVQLRNECAELIRRQGYPQPTGQAKITGAYNLPCRFVLHTVGPIVQGELTEHNTEQLADCYRSCLALAKENNLRSISFCCISTGEYHFPNAKAANIAVNVVTDFQETNPDMSVVFNVFKDEDYRIYRELFRERI